MDTKLLPDSLVKLLDPVYPTRPDYVHAPQGAPKVGEGASDVLPQDLQDAFVLVDKALQNMESRGPEGWAKGAWFNGSQHCLWGFIQEAAGVDSAAPNDDIRELLVEVGINPTDVVNYNDGPASTFEKVVQTMKHWRARLADKVLAAISR